VAEQLPLLEVHDLTIDYRTPDGDVHAVDGVSFSLKRGTALGIVGESGCGKTSIVGGILNLLPENGRYVRGSVVLDGINLLALSEKELQAIRWSKISVVFQNAMSALDPVYKVGDLLREILQVHGYHERTAAERRIKEVFDLVSLPSTVIKSYPHQLSGGMKQRVSIAASLICGPEIVILDEPTTALDVLLQDTILRELEELRRTLDLSIIVVSHDISVVSELCDRVAVMYAGRVVETAETKVIFSDSRNPYTTLLIRSLPKAAGEKTELVGIAGSPPALVDPPRGCRFHPRCPFEVEVCRQLAPPWRELAPDHYSLCHFEDFPDAR
jgi:peptide/nickel transport system ATP-binding protein